MIFEGKMTMTAPTIVKAVIVIVTSHCRITVSLHKLAQILAFEQNL